MHGSDGEKAGEDALVLTGPLMKGKRGLIMGVANDHSIAWGIARALAMEPKVLLLDEPFGALDALTRAHLQDSVMALHQKLGNTVMMITHDVDEAVLLSDRIVMMTNGPAAKIGEILEVPLARPRKRLELVSDAAYTKCRAAVLKFLYERHRYVEAA